MKIIIALLMVSLFGCEPENHTLYDIQRSAAVANIKAEKEEEVFTPYWVITAYSGGNFTPRQWAVWDEPEIIDGYVCFDNVRVSGNVVVEKITQKPHE